jgi:hypothetical protein
MATSTEQRRVAVITGGSGGIGRATAQRLAADGMTIVVHYARNSDHAEEVVKAITDAGGQASSMQADVGDQEEVAALFDETESRYGSVDVVVNTAGILLLAPIVDYALDDFDRMVRTNLRGTFLVSQQAARRVRSGGAIINFSSSVVKIGLETYSAYGGTAKIRRKSPSGPLTPTSSTPTTATPSLNSSATARCPPPTACASRPAANPSPAGRSPGTSLTRASRATPTSPTRTRRSARRSSSPPNATRRSRSMRSSVTRPSCRYSSTRPTATARPSPRSRCSTSSTSGSRRGSRN